MVHMRRQPVISALDPTNRRSLASMTHVRTAFLEELATLLAPAELITDPDIIEPYSRDRAEGAKPGLPIAVVRARTTGDVRATIATATRHHVPVVTRGAGTGLSGGASAIDGCVVLSTERMRLISVDAASMVAVAQPGVLNVEVKEAARACGLWYPPDPSSFEISSIGGNVATNAGGLCCVKYGVTGDYVLAVEVVLADGTTVRLGRNTIKDVAGYDLKRLFIGSEGTLGVITEVTLRLRSSPPPAATLVATFPSVHAASTAITAIMATVQPSMLELMDRTTIRAVERLTHMGFDESCGAVLLAQTDNGAAQGESDIAQIRLECEAAGADYVATTSDATEGEQLMAARRMAVPALQRLGTTMIEDIGVPLPRVADLVTGIEEIAKQYETTIATFGHAGDGNLHPLILWNHADPDATGRCEHAFAAVMDLALTLGGTITGEHGIGTLKRPWLAAQLGPDTMELARRIKTALDPMGILNPGKAV